jgi:predicted ATPase
MWMTVIANRYQLQQEIGAGAMGAVFKGTDTQTGQPVAIKRLKPEIANAEIIERFRREGEALRDLNHSNIVKLLDTVEEAGYHYLVMEYVPGGDLRLMLTEKEQLSIEDSVNIALDLADALTRAHRLNIIHRDLKPANILIAEDSTPRLTDFGVAHFAAAQPVTETGVAIGTMGYLSPEVLQGYSVDERADIWAFGIILFEMLTGKRPFTGDIAAQIITSTLREPVPDIETLRPDCPIALQDLLYRILEKDPNTRIRSIRIVGAELEAILKGYNFTTIPTATSVSGRFETPLPDGHPAKHNLPLQATPFIGRAGELAELAKLLNDPNLRLLTILAPGGMGKTRLALEAASQIIQIAKFTDGVYFVDLAPLGSFDDQLLSTLQQFMTMLRSGYSVLQCFEYLADNAPEPTARVTRNFVADVKNGVAMPQAMQSMREQVKSKYVGQLVDVMLKQFHEGGNLADRLDELSNRLRAELGDKRWNNNAEYAEELIVPAIAAAIQYQFQGADNQKTQLLDFLRHRKMLLVLDNFEHLVAGAGLVTDVLATASDIKMLVTSRQRLSQPGETLFHLSGMTFPDWLTPEDALQYAAVQLFVSSAKRNQPRFELTPTNLDSAAYICKFVQGMPLGIILAAAWSAMLSPQEIVLELQQGMDILADEAGGIPERQKSIRTVLDYSWQTMDAAEQTIFMKLSVFQGGFTREAAQTVTGANLRQLMALVNKSLIQRDTESGRYAVHELLRQYAMEKLVASGQAETVRHTHMIYFAQWLAQYENEIIGHARIEICHTIDADFDNVRSAWLFAVAENNLQALNQMVATLQEFFMTGFHWREHINLIQFAAQQVQPDANQQAAYGRLLIRANDVNYAPQVFTTEPVRQNIEKALAIARTTGNQYEEGFALRILSAWYEDRGQYKRCLELLAQVEAVAGQLPGNYLQQLLYFFKGMYIKIHERDFEKAITCWEIGLSLAQQRADVLWQSWNLVNISVAEAMLGNLARYEIMTLESLAIARRANMKIQITHQLRRSGYINLAWGRFEEAKCYFDEASPYVLMTYPDPMIAHALIAKQYADLEFYQGNYAAARQHILAADDFAAQRQHSEDEYIPIEFYTTNLQIACGLEDYGNMRLYMKHIIVEGLKGNHIMDLLDVLIAYQCLLAHHGQYEQSVKICSVVQHHRSCLPVRKMMPLQQKWKATVKQHVTEEAFQAAWKRDETADVYQMAEQILKELEVGKI